MTKETRLELMKGSLREEKTYEDQTYNRTVKRRAREFCYRHCLDVPDWCAALHAHGYPLAVRVDNELKGLKAILDKMQADISLIFHKLETHSNFIGG